MMAQVNFKFLSDAAGGDGFTVVSFSGNEAISRLYRYELEIKTLHSASVNLDDVLNSPARFITELDGEEFPVYGVLSSIDELQTVHGYVHYQVVLVPRIWWLSIYKTNEIYTVEKTVDQIIQRVLENADFNSDIDFDLSGLNTGDLIKRNYRCQFGESDFDFLSRLMQNEGIFYYFDHSGDAEKMVFLNDISYLKIVQPELIFDVNTQTRQLHDSINAWSCRKQRLPANVTVRDYNPDHPSLDISGTAAVDTMGRGTEYHYGDNLGDENEAEIISEIRAEERLCNKTRYYGESSVPRLQAGYTFNLDMHPNEDYNGMEYLTLEVNHSGQNLDMSMSGESQQSSPAMPQYRNNFVAIDASEQYRPDRITPKPRFYGTMTAFVYSEVGKNMAEIDEYGRYRVHLPFDRADGTRDSTDPDRKASTWIRKAQDYVGEGKGSYFPLTGGTEVLLSFINGDPDQPIIVGAVPNASEPSLMTTDNEFESITQTGSGNKIRMGDVEGQDRIVMESPMANSWMRIGTMNDPITLQGESPQFVGIGTGPYLDPMAYSTDYTSDPFNQTDSAPFPASEIKDHGDNIVTSIDTSIAGEYILKYVDSNNTNDIAFRKVIVSEPGSFNDLSGNDNDGIRIRSAGNLWSEAKSRYGEYYTGNPTTAPHKTGTNPPEIGDLLDHFGIEYKPTNLYKRETFNSSTKSYDSYCTNPDHAGTDTDDSFANAIASGHVKVSSLDTFNTQEGNVYDFGGYWVYNLGNGYVENHIDQQANLNEQHDSTMGDIGKDIENIVKVENLTDFGSGAAKVAGVAFQAVGTVSSVLSSVVFTGVAIAVAAKQGGPGGAVATGIVSAILPIAALASAGLGLGIKYIASAKNIGDVIAGPDSGEIKTWANKVGSSFDFSTGKQTKERRSQKYDMHYGVDFMPCAPSFGYFNNPMHTNSTLVEKTFCDSYSFTQGNSIEITHGNSEVHTKGDIYEYKYGGLRESASFSKGYLSHWEKSGHGQKTVVNWDKSSGQMSGFSYDYKGFFNFSMTMPSSPKLKINVALSSLDASVKVSMGTAINVNITEALKVNVDLAAGFYVKFDRKIGGEVTWNEVTGERKFKAFGLKTAKAEAFEAKKNQLIIDEAASLLSKKQMDYVQKELGVEKSTTGLKIGQYIYL